MTNQGGDIIGKTETKRTYSKRTPKDIAMAKANTFVRHLHSVVNEAKSLKTRINDLPASDFSEIAIGLNNVLLDNVPQLQEQIFAVTEKDSVDSPTPESETSFTTYMTQETPTPETPTPEIPDNEGE